MVGSLCTIRAREPWLLHMFWGCDAATIGWLWGTGTWDGGVRNMPIGSMAFLVIIHFAKVGRIWLLMQDMIFFGLTLRIECNDSIFNSILLIVAKPLQEYWARARWLWEDCLESKMVSLGFRGVLVPKQFAIQLLQASPNSTLLVLYSCCFFLWYLILHVCNGISLTGIGWGTCTYFSSMKGALICVNKSGNLTFCTFLQ